jgi:nucleolar protein 4
MAAAPAAAGAPSPDVDARTLFVRGVSYDATQSDLETAFAAVGPVRSAFLVGGADGGRHRGLGFVQFALPDDALVAVAQLNGAAIKGRKIKVRRERRGGGGGAARPFSAHPPRPMLLL